MIPKEIIEEVKDRLIKVYDPIKIYLFGSYAWGTPHEDSDLDLDESSLVHKITKEGKVLYGRQ